MCRALDGLPLAIELAAARAKVLSVQEIARRLDDRFTLLHDPTSRLPARQRTLRAAIGWSYDLLFPDDQRGLWALACFSGGAPLAAAEARAGRAGRTGRLRGGRDRPAGRPVAGRASRSVRAARSATGCWTASGSSAGTGCGSPGLADVALGAHAALFAGPRPSGPRRGIRGRGPGRTSGDGTHRARQHRRRTGLGGRARSGARPAYRQRFRLGLGVPRRRARRGRAQPVRARRGGPAAAVADRVDGLLFAGWFEASGGDLERAAADVREAIAIADDRRGARSGPAVPGVRAQPAGPAARRARRAGRPDRRCRAIGLGGGRGVAAHAPGREIALGRGRPRAGGLRRGAAAAGPLGDGWALSHAEALLGALAQAEHRFADATAHLARAADAAHALGFLAAGSLHRANLGRAHEQNGDPPPRSSAFEARIGTAHAAGDLRIVALAQVRLARVWRALGDGRRRRGSMWAPPSGGTGRPAAATARCWPITGGRPGRRRRPADRSPGTRPGARTTPRWRC